MEKRFLLAEYCSASFYMGWHLYLRDTKEKGRCNKDGAWGWLRGINRSNPAQQVFDELGIEIKGDGTCDDDGIAEIARRFPGGIEVDVDYYGRITLRRE